MFLGVGDSPAELLLSRSARGGDQDEDNGRESEEARGTPPMILTLSLEEAIGVVGEVTVGEYGRFVRTTPRLVLSDIEVAYQSCKRRIEREGSVVLSSIHFTCSVRPDLVEVSTPTTRAVCVRALCRQGNFRPSWVIHGIDEHA